MSQRLRATPWFRDEFEEEAARRIRRINVYFPTKNYDFINFLEDLNTQHNSYECPNCRVKLELWNGKLSISALEPPLECGALIVNIVVPEGY